jgi:hypothetical protein
MAAKLQSTEQRTGGSNCFAATKDSRKSEGIQRGRTEMHGSIDPLYWRGEREREENSEDRSLVDDLTSDLLRFLGCSRKKKKKEKTSE